ncbi:MAG: hypothetical protein IJO65_10960 [Lachnospiraceae bacterium]|nr:hypothetical protein [Lachnospiraceae bacterium]
MMLISVCVMGMCVSLLVMTSFGPDPCSAMNYGVADLVGLSFGTYQAALNVVLFIFVFFCDRSLLGPGSFGNMILVGYSADFMTWLMGRVFGISEITGLVARIIVMLVVLFVFVVAAAIYMNSGLGTAPYDALVFLIHKTLCKKMRKDIPFKAVRMAYDALVTLIAFLVGGEVGVITVLMIVLLGPAIELVGKRMMQ